MSTSVMMWLILGCVLMFSEFLLPGLVVIFLGFGALTVAALDWAGIVETIPSSIIAWFILSLLYLIVLRTVIIRFFPGEVTKAEDLDDETEVFGDVVEVVEKVDADGNKGRIRYQGSTWPAKCIDAVLLPGQKGKIIYRDELTYVIEPFDAIDVTDEP